MMESAEAAIMERGATHLAFLISVDNDWVRKRALQPHRADLASHHAGLRPMAKLVPCKVHDELTRPSRHDELVAPGFIGRVAPDQTDLRPQFQRLRRACNCISHKSLSQRLMLESRARERASSIHTNRARDIPSGLL